MKRFEKMIKILAMTSIIFIGGALPVTTNAVEQIEGFRCTDGVYYKLQPGSTWFAQCNCFSQEQDIAYIEVGQYVSIPIHMLKFSSGYEPLSQPQEREDDNIRFQCMEQHTVSYSSSNTDVCTVSEDGIVTAVGEGEAEITVISGEYYAVTSLKIHVIKPERTLTTEYQSLSNMFDSIYQKYGQPASINDSNYKTAWKEIMEADKLWKSYSSNIEKTYGQDAETKRQAYKNADSITQYRSDIKKWYDISECTLNEIAKYDYQRNTELTGWGKDFCHVLMVHSDSWKLEEAIKNLSRYIKTINPYNKDNANAFQIRSIKMEKSGNQLVIQLKKPITEKQLLGSYMSYRDTYMEPLVWSAMLQNGFTKTSIPCVATVYQKDSKFVYKMELYEGSYEKGEKKIILKRKNRKINKANMPAGTYKVELNPISPYWSPQERSYSFTMYVSTTLKIGK